MHPLPLTKNVFLRIVTFWTVQRRVLIAEVEDVVVCAASTSVHQNRSKREEEREHTSPSKHSPHVPLNRLVKRVESTAYSYHATHEPAPLRESAPYTSVDKSNLLPLSPPVCRNTQPITPSTYQTPSHCAHTYSLYQIPPSFPSAHQHQHSAHINHRESNSVGYSFPRIAGRLRSAG
jgi:hypothetical protein